MLGIIVSPVALNLWDSENDAFGGTHNLDRLTLEVSRVVLCIQCMAAGISLPGKYVSTVRLSMFVLLGPVLVISWLITTLGMRLIMGLGWYECLVIAACLTPTDPILANSIVEGKFAEEHIPLGVRQILSAESAANDGLGLPFVLLPFFLMRVPNPGNAVGDWLYKIILYQVILSVVVGILFGYFARKSLKFAERHGLIDKQSILSFSVGLAVAVMGVMSIVGADDILSCFVAGSVFSWDMWFNKQIQDSHLQTVIDSLLNLTYFVFFGTRIPWSAVGALGAWKLICFALWILILRRVPVVMTLHRWIPALKSRREAFFCGWFGPIGGSAIYYAMLTIVYVELESSPIWPLVSYIVLVSIVIHGGTVSLFHFGLTRHSTYQTWREAGHTSKAAVAAALRGRLRPSDISVARVADATAVELSNREAVVVEVSEDECVVVDRNATTVPEKVSEEVCVVVDGKAIVPDRADVGGASGGSSLVP
ncbi:hypothetical protein HK104_001209 [Borealophlyctis nickersoniae]|nr:hypothetical protein HK104_001209 [Borealophlyctis nickersoniae]